MKSSAVFFVYLEMGNWNCVLQVRDKLQREMEGGIRTVLQAREESLQFTVRKGRGTQLITVIS